MGVEIDLSKAHHSRVHGQFTAVYTWVNDERALVLLNHMRDKSPWFIVGESVAWKYDDTQYLAAKARQACDVLGMEPSINTWTKLATIIHEGLGDLIAMPSSPPVEYHSAAVGSILLREQGKVIAAEDIRIAKSGAKYA